jgi:hypothetical protein
MAAGTEACDASLGNGTSVPGFAGVPFTVLYKVMNAADIIAADPTLAAAGKIAAGQEITAFTLPVGFIVFGTVTYVTEAGTAGGTINIGTYANTTAFDAAVSIATAGAALVKTATDAGGMDAASGTIITSTASDGNKVCVEYIADETTGEFVVAMFGLDLSEIKNK